MWLNLAVDMGNMKALFIMGELSQRMTPSQMEEAERLTNEWREIHN
jgi:hypothetical protein